MALFIQICHYALFLSVPFSSFLLHLPWPSLAPGTANCVWPGEAPPLAFCIFKVSSVHALLCSFSFNHFFLYSNGPQFNVSVFLILTYAAFSNKRPLILMALGTDCWLRCAFWVYVYWLWGLYCWPLYSPFPYSEDSACDLSSSLLCCSLLGYVWGGDRVSFHSLV